MPLHLIRNDITKMNCDAIVNAANRSLLGGGGVDGAIHRAAGPQLLAECRTLGGCETGKAKITAGYLLPAKYIIHTVGPIWRGGVNGEKALLESCYRESLKLAVEYKCESIAFPLISGGAYGYPREQALTVAMDTISAFMLENDLENDLDVYMVVWDSASVFVSESLYNNIVDYLGDNYIEEKKYFAAEHRRSRFIDEEMAFCECREPMPWEPPMFCRKMQLNDDLADRLATPDESFSQMLLRLIDESGMKDSECYKRANLDRKHFSKIRSDSKYRPSKPTVLSFAIALKLNYEKTKLLLKSAGFAFSRSSKFDIIIEYFIEHEDYDINKINQVLFSFDQSLLGA